MGKSFIKLSIDAREMTRALRDAPDAVRDAVAGAVFETTRIAYKRVRLRTPVDSTKAIRGWKINLSRIGLRGTIENNVPYIRVLEYGGYPVRPLARASRRPPGSFVRGKALLGGLPPGPRTAKARTSPIPLEPKALPRGRDMNSNVSRQAPHGMLRITFAEIVPEFLQRIEESLDRAFDDLERSP